MTLALIAVVVAWLNVAVGVTLAVLRVARWRVPGWLLWMHPVAATAALVCAWWAVAVWAGPADLLFNSGAFVLALAFVAGGFLYWLGRAGVPPLIPAIALHGAAAVGGSVLLTMGFLRVFTG